MDEVATKPPFSITKTSTVPSTHAVRRCFQSILLVLLLSSILLLGNDWHVSDDNVVQRWMGGSGTTAAARTNHLVRRLSASTDNNMTPSETSVKKVEEQSSLKSPDTTSNEMKVVKPNDGTEKIEESSVPAGEMKMSHTDEKDKTIVKTNDVKKVEDNQEDIQRKTRKCAYVSSLPAIDKPWPIESNKSNDTDSLSLSILVPGLAFRYINDLRNLLPSIAWQTEPAQEIVIVQSGVHLHFGRNAKDPETRNVPVTFQEGEELCRQIHSFARNMLLKHDHSRRTDATNIRVLCVGEIMTAGFARNTAARIASGDVFAFIDADDMMLPMRNEIIRNVFDCRPSLKLFTHAFIDSQAGGQKRDVRLQHAYVRNHVRKEHDSAYIRKERWSRNNTAFFDEYFKYGIVPSRDAGKPQNAMMNNEQGKFCVENEPGLNKWKDEDFYRENLNNFANRKFWGGHYPHSMHPGHIVVHRSVFDYIQYGPLPYGQDQMFLRHFLHAFDSAGREGEQAVLMLDRPLTTYFQIGHWAKKAETKKKKQKITKQIDPSKLNVKQQ